MIIVSLLDKKDKLEQPVTMWTPPDDLPVSSLLGVDQCAFSCEVASAFAPAFQSGQARLRTLLLQLPVGQPVRPCFDERRVHLFFVGDSDVGRGIV